MKESFAIELCGKEGPLNLLWVNRGWIVGAVVNDEFSSFPRPLYLHMRAAGAGTRERMKRVRQREGWSPDEFRLTRYFRNNLVGFRGVRSNALPAGNYIIQVYFKGYPKSDEVQMTLEDGQETLVPVELERGERPGVSLSRPVDAFDSQIKRVIEDDRSKLDLKPLRTWVADDTRTPRRRACLLNLLAKLRSTPSPSQPLIRHVEYIFVADIDRIYASVKPAYLAQLESMTKSGAVSSTHRKLLKWNNLDPKEFKLRSFREPTTETSLQSILAVPKNGPDGSMFADLDLDEANPEIDLVRFFKHVGELLDGHPTDHLELRDRIARGPAGDFLYYQVDKTA